MAILLLMPTHAIRTVELPSGVRIPALGQGTWQMAEDARHIDDEIAALQVGIELGLRLIDTAEMYADGRAEQLVAQAIAGRRDQVYLVSKVLPSHSSRTGTIAACEASLRRLRTDRIDLYLLHWRGREPLEETVAGFEALREAGKIGGWGVSNLDVDDIEELLAVDRGAAVQTDQVLYNLARRGIENDLLPWCRTRGLPIMAYSPIERGELADHPTLARVAARHHATPAQVALAWVLRHPDVCAIPKASTPAHVRENHRALDLHLGAHDLAELDHEFPPPRRRVPLEMH